MYLVKGIATHHFRDLTKMVGFLFYTCVCINMNVTNHIGILIKFIIFLKTYPAAKQSGIPMHSSITKRWNGETGIISTKNVQTTKTTG